jgi:CRP-like cAMP-binding protein
MSKTNAGASFGELAALGLNTERTLTVQARTKSIVYRIRAEDFYSSMIERPEVRFAFCFCHFPSHTCPSTARNMHKHAHPRTHSFTGR